MPGSGEWPDWRGKSRDGTGVTWSHPAFAYGCVFARNDSMLVCAYLGE